MVEDAAGAEEVAGEGDFPAVDLADEHAAAVGVALGGDDLEFHVAPGEGFVVLEIGVDGDVLGEGEEGVAVVVVVVDALVLPEEFGLVEEVAFVFGDGDFGAVLAKAGVPQDWSRWWWVWRTHSTWFTPISCKVVDEGAGAGVDEDGAVA